MLIWKNGSVGQLQINKNHFIKLLPTREWTYKKSKRRILWCNELSVLQTLPKHPNIIELFQYTETPIFRTMTFEYYPMGTLHDYWHTRLPLSVYVTADMFLQIIAGLHWLHLHGLFHFQLSDHHVVLMRSNTYACGYNLRIIDLTRCHSQSIISTSPLQPNKPTGQQQDLLALEKMIYKSKFTVEGPTNTRTLQDWHNIFLHAVHTRANWPTTTWAVTDPAEIIMWLAETNNNFYAMATNIWKATTRVYLPALTYCATQKASHSPDLPTIMILNIRELLLRALHYENDNWFAAAMVLYKKAMYLIQLVEQEHVIDEEYIQRIKAQVVLKLA